VRWARKSFELWYLGRDAEENERSPLGVTSLAWVIESGRSMRREYMTSHLKKWRAVLFAAMCMGSFLIVACSKSETPPPAKTEEVKQ